MTITKDEMIKLQEINKNLSIKEVIEIYLPLSHLLNFYYDSHLHQQKSVLEQLLHDKKKHRIPYIISIIGSVAAGKSTIARILQTLLSRWPTHRRVELITTDSFLYPNRTLKDRGLMKKKGFPSSYDMHRLMKFVADIKLGVSDITIPVYTHLIYDVVPNFDKKVTQSDILILEGLNYLHNKIYYQHDHHHIVISDFIDFSIYVDAPEELLKRWYINRFLKFREWAFTEPHSHFYNYTHLSKGEAIGIATLLWDEINCINLKENILPTRKYASLILRKRENHIIDKVYLRN